MEKPTRQSTREKSSVVKGTPVTIDVFDRQPEFNVDIEKIKNCNQQRIFEYREITDDPNPKYRKLCYPDHPNEIPQPHQGMGLIYQVQTLTEQVQTLTEQAQTSFQTLRELVHQYKESQDTFEKSVEVDRKYSVMVQGSSPLFAVQDLVIELVESCEDKARECIPQFSNLKKRFQQSPEKKLVAGAYDWLLQQLERGDPDVRACTTLVHFHVPEMLPRFDVKEILASLTSYREARKQRNWRGHPCILSPKGDDIIRFVETLVKGEDPLPKPYKDSDKRLVERAISLWLRTSKQKEGSFARFKRAWKMPHRSSSI